MQPQQTPDAQAIVDAVEIDALIRLLRDEGYTVIGPTLRDGVIVQDELAGARDLPAGWTARQDAATYRIERRDDAALFGHVVGPHSPKALLHPSRLKLFEARRDGAGNVSVTEECAQPPRYAFLGLRDCEIRAIAVQDRVYLSPDHADPDYAARRRDALIVAVDCNEPAASCFCTSMGGDPSAGAGHDLALTELIDSAGHRFAVRAGSEAGAALLDRLAHRAAPNTDVTLAKALHERARGAMGRHMDTTGIKALLQDNAEHPHWDDVAERCLGCANCTLVCPTCFCSSVEEVSDLGGERVERWRRDDSCFNIDFSYIHGGAVRTSTRSRYRQWLTHKLAHWIDQFGSSGCVGCGRCVTWCPVGIDITAEVQALREPAHLVASAIEPSGPGATTP